jgi:excisionase family DNA binding protein
MSSELERLLNGSHASRPATDGPGPLPERLALSVEEAARLVGISRRQIYEEITRGRLRTVKVGKRRLVPHDDLKHWLRTRPPG